MTTRNISDRWLQSKAKPGLYWDEKFSGFGVRVSDTGRKTFLLNVRFPGQSNPARRALGHFGPMTLAQARRKAGEWVEMVEQGTDPEIEQESARAAEQRKRSTSFRSVAETFIAEKLSKERKGDEVARDIRNNFLGAWGGRPITEIRASDIAAIVKEKAKDAPAQARNLLTTAKRLFQWAIDQHAYGLEASPAAVIKPAALVGEKIARNRNFSDAEVVAFLRAVERMQYPYGPLYRLLLLTGLRLNEVADAQWSEIDTEKKIWIIPASRMKGKDSRAREHAVPLTAEMLEILESLPRFKYGEYLFSTEHGKVPVWIGSKVKAKLDALMLSELQAMADDPRKVTLPPWVNHDLRRVVRAGMSRLRIATEVAEAILAHVRPGIQGTYDVHDYLDEKRSALEAWSGRLRELTTPSPANVVRLEKARA
jgi:integrase